MKNEKHVSHETKSFHQHEFNKFKKPKFMFDKKFQLIVGGCMLYIMISIIIGTITIAKCIFNLF